MSDIAHVDAARSYLLELQQRIVDALEAADGGGHFIRDGWTKAAGEKPLAPETPSASPPQGGAPGLGRPGAALMPPSP